jgi:hypothetical protein
MVDLSELLRKRITKEINNGNHHDWILFNYDKAKKPFLFIPIKLYPSLQNTAILFHEIGRGVHLLLHTTTKIFKNYIGRDNYLQMIF